MQNYKALKASSKVSVRKQEAAAAVYNDDGSIKTAEVFEELQIVSKSYDPSTGQENDDVVSRVSISSVSSDIDRCKSEVSSIQARQADLEQLEKDLKAL